MAKENETIAGIIAEMRSDANADEYTPDGILGQKLNYIADRLEAAHKREKAAIEADALSVGGLVEAMRQKEAICTKCRDGEPPKNCQFFGEPDGCSSPTYGHYPQLPIGDAAKLREALSKLCAYSAVVLNAGMFNRIHLEALLNMANAALAAPPRNCDVYNNESCRMAYHLHGDGLMTMQAFADWLYAPATEKEGGAK